MEHHYPSFLPPLYPSQFFCPLYFHFTHFPQKWINARKNAPTLRTGGSLFSGIVEFCALNLERPRAHCDLSFCFSMLFPFFLSLLSFMSLCRPCHTCQHRPLPVPRCAKRKTVLFLLCMVFTEDLGNCSLAVRTTTASNTGPVDGFVKRAFNETPGDGILVAPCFCRLFSPPPPFVVRFWLPQHMRSMLLY